MGWSCSAAANEVLKRWVEACRAQTGSQNEFVVDGRKYFWDITRTEWEDGAITGSICRTLNDTSPDGRFLCRKVGTFRINGDGTVARAPTFLRGL
jgi:hypothetical protein